MALRRRFGGGEVLMRSLAMYPLEALFAELLDEPSLRVTFGAKRKKSQPMRRVTLRSIGEALWQFEYFSDTQAFHKNLDRRSALVEAVRLCEQEFKQIDARTEREEVQVLASKPENPRIVRKPIAVDRPASCSARTAGAQTAEAQSAGTHNRKKRYLLPEGTPIDFLIRLGVSDPSGKIHPRSYAKFRQINRFLEIVDDVYCHAQRGDSGRPIRVIDFGCGKAYLTFALYYYFTRLLGRSAEIVGLDLKQEVIAFCNRVAEDLGYEGLRFEQGDIAHYPESRVDLMVSLHACDTATDLAIAQAVRWGAQTILAVPCCQHELFSQLRNALHHPLLKHGILKDKMTELLTDALRGLRLESQGYEVSMIEFTSLEHTAKNTMIRAVKSKQGAPVKPSRSEQSRSEGARRERARREFQELVDFWQVDPTIARIMP